jgi:hypothetical protein
MVPSDPGARRVLLAGCAGLLLTVPVLAHDSLSGRLVLGWLAVAAGVALAVTALRRRSRPGRRTALVATALCAAAAASTGALLLSTLISPPSADLRCRDDVAAATFGAADQLRTGHNPYAAYDALRAQQAAGCANPAVTALRRGQFAAATAMPGDAEVSAATAAALRDPSRPEIERSLNYPGGTVLFGLVGPAAFPWLMALLLAGAIALTVRRATVDRRAAFLGLGAQAAVLSLVPDGHTDAAVLVMLLLAWAGPTTLLGGLALGLACGTKQTAWFLAPALLATAYSRGGRHGLSRTTAGAAIGFAALNAPFIVMGPGAYLHGVLGPLLDGLFPLGVGPVGLITSGVLPIQAAPLFTALMLGCVAASVVAALRWDRTHPGIAVLLGALALFLGPRSLLEYIAGAGLLLAAAVATAPRQPAAAATTKFRPATAKTTAPALPHHRAPAG